MAFFKNVIGRIARRKQRSLLAAFILAWSGVASAAPPNGFVAKDGPALFGIPVDFILFGLILLGVALFRHHTLKVALCGLFVISVYKIIFTGFRYGDHWVTHERCP